jgi:predicted nuclease with RNAse H fold
VLTAGVDLAAEPKGTALAVIEWKETTATLVDLQLGVNDQTIVEAAGVVDKLGIDCALGWPIEFVEFLNNHANLENTSFPDGGMDWRRRTSFRESDRHVREVTGKWPLSVSTDRLGLTAMRCAGLQGRIQQSGIEIDRSGSGKIVEIYPGASLRLWGFDTTGYRANEDVRAELLTTIEHSVPWLNLDSHRELMISSTDAFDAVIASLATRAAAINQYLHPPKEFLDIAKVEGWIALPTGSITDLLRE